MTDGTPPTPDDGYDAPAAMRAALGLLAQPPSGAAAPFVSDLTVGELVLLDEVGYEPVDLVIGAGAASWSAQAAASVGQLDRGAWSLTHALASAREEVAKEVHQRGADGVVAVHLDLHRHPANVVTCTMVGTAVRRHRPSGGHGPSAAHGPSDGHRMSGGHRPGGGPQRAGGRPPEPFTTTLSAADFHLLVRAGYLPAGMVVGAAMVGFPARSVAQGLGISRENVELGDQTAALYAAREQAMSRLDAEARQVGADGVVAVTFSEHPIATVLVRAVELLVVGTAVRRGDRHRSIGPRLQLGLDDPPPQVFQRG